MHFPDPGSSRYSRMREAGEGDRRQAEEGGTKRGKRGTNPLLSQSYSPPPVETDYGSTPPGLEHLQADLCRPLGAVSTRPSALPDGVLRGSGGEDARLWQSRDDGLCRVPLPALWPGQAPGV